MDKIIGVGWLMAIGTILTAGCLALGLLFDDDVDKGQSDNDYNMRIYVPHRSGDRRSNNRHDQQGVNIND